MKILLIGKSGQLGSEILKEATRREYKIKAFGREELDITDFGDVKSQVEAFGPEFVINTSAYHAVSACEDEPEQAFLINSISLKPIASLCEEKNIRFVTYSTDYVFDGSKGTLYEEEDNPNPLQIYGLSKLAGEFIVLNYSPKSIVIRTCGVYGGLHGSRSKKGNFTLNILEQAKREKIIEVATEQIVSPTYAVDLAKATLDLLAKGNISGVYHLANEGFCSWAQFAKEIVKNKGLSTEIIPVDRKGVAGSLKRPLFSALKNTKAASLGIKLPSWQNGLERYLQTLK